MENSTSDYGNACSGFNSEELAELASIANQYAEATGLVIKLASWAGDKAHGLMAKAPPDWQKRIEDATDLALRASYAAAFATQPDEASESYLSRALSWQKVSAGIRSPPE